MQDKLKPEPEDASVPKTPRMPTPPLSSMDSVKRARWPHQNSRTPTPAPLSKSSKWEITLKRRRTPSRSPSRALAACAGRIIFQCREHAFRKDVEEQEDGFSKESTPSVAAKATSSEKHDPRDAISLVGFRTNDSQANLPHHQ